MWIWAGETVRLFARPFGGTSPGRGKGVGWELASDGEVTLDGELALDGN